MSDWVTSGFVVWDSSTGLSDKPDPLDLDGYVDFSDELFDLNF